MGSIRSPSESVAREVMEHSAFRVKYFNEDANKVHMGENSSKSPQQEEAPYSRSPIDDREDSGTNDAFSDSQFGEIADEEDYKGERAMHERDLNSLSNAGSSSDIVVALQQPMNRPTMNFSGKYTSCTNKNDSLNFQNIQKRLPTIRQIGHTVS